VSREWGSKERADLLFHGVVLDTITALELAGYSTLQQLAALDRRQLAAIAGVGDVRAATVTRALGKMMDVAVAELRSGGTRKD